MKRSINEVKRTEKKRWDARATMNIALLKYKKRRQ